MSVGAAWPSLLVHRQWLQHETERLLAFGANAPNEGGAAWLDDDGMPDPSQPVGTWVTARMVHVYAVGHLLGIPGCRPLAQRALTGLTGPLHDDDHGGWFPRRDPDGTVAPEKRCYDHAFVVLAATSAAAAGLAGAGAVLDEALAVLGDRFWDDEAGLFVEAWNADFTRLDDYRGVNANMHAVEALMAAADATGDDEWLHRASRIAGFVVGQARQHGWRIPEHFGPDWTPDLRYHDDRRDDPFLPYGATVGHALEWSRLLLHLEAAGASGEQWLEAARSLYAVARQDGWFADGAPGFVYTTDWDGTPVVRRRFHWVVAEAVAAAAALAQRTGEAAYEEDYARWWDYAATSLIDRERGSWHHELDSANRPAHTVWRGKPDLYHALQATLIPRLPLAPSLATAVARGLLR